ncbi:hypothetical protein, partial [Actinomadura terrae]|uniref:hypothetical protein n=1 Tax=Actinomadura terrae TaxID=604353 RepID=UPI001FA76DE8
LLYRICSVCQFPGFSDTPFRSADAALPGGVAISPDSARLSKSNRSRSITAQQTRRSRVG